MTATITYGLDVVQNEFQANTFTQYNQWTPDVLGLSGGGYVVAYSNGQLAGVFMQLDFYNASGELVAGPVTPFNVGFSSSSGGAPSLTELDNGNVLVVWDENIAGHVGLAGAIFSPSGGVVASEFQITFLLSDLQPQVTALTGGGFVVSYANTNGDIAFKVFDDDGNFQNIGGADISSGYNSSDPVITALADGGFAVTWTEYNGANSNIVGRIFEADGDSRPVNGLTTPFFIGIAGDNTQPAIAALPNGNFAVAYTDSGWANEDTGITLTIVGPDGSIVVPYVHVNIAGDPANESDPDITVLDNGFIVVSWTEPTANGDILFRIFDENGNVPPGLVSTPVLVSNSPTADIKSTVSAMLDGQFITAWQDSESDGSGGEIKATVSALVRITTGDGTSETLSGDGYHDRIFGNGGADNLNGFGANDLLDGGAGADTMTGGAGDDTYVVDNVGDVIVELNGGGTDTVESSIAFSLVGKYLENLTLTGGANIDATGNNYNNILIGNSGNNKLNGSTGGDYMEGGDGDDTYIVDNASDFAVEAGGGGTDLVQSSVATMIFGDIEKLTLVGTADISGIGNDLNNTLVGNSGNNQLDGKLGADLMSGGLGDDFYRVDNAADVVTEGAGAGTDWVVTFVTHTLSANVENLAFDGVANINGTGNDLANSISGNSGDNVLKGLANNDTLQGSDGNDLLDGGTGADSMTGGADNDTYVVDNAGDTIVETGGGIDTVESSLAFSLVGTAIENLTLTGASNVNATGNGFDNIIVGNSGANLINALVGADSMAGGAGNDTYVVDNAGDTVTEANGAGTDLVQSSVTFSLVGQFAEKLTLTGSANIDGTGNTLDNTIVGNSGANKLNGSSGGDAMTGGAGDDTYIVDNVGDTAVEAAGGGTDLVQSTVSFAMGTAVDNLTFVGALAVDGVGNGSANVMVGNSAVNHLDGNAGTDTLTGGGAADVFIFDDNDGVDTVVDFQNSSDKFDVSAVNGVNGFADLDVIDNGATLTIDYGTGSFIIGNVGNAALIDAADFIF